MANFEDAYYKDPETGLFVPLPYIKKTSTLTTPEEIVAEARKDIVSDPNYVHTDNNFTNAYKDNLTALSANKRVIVNLGDSLGEGNIPSGQYSYVDYLQTRYGSFTNCCIGGTCLSTHPNTYYGALSITSLATAIATNTWTSQDAAVAYLATQGDDNTAILTRLKAVVWSEVTDLVIEAGTNDFGISAPNALGDPSSTSLYTIWGAVKHISNTIGTAYPNIRIHFLTPIFRSRILPGDNKNSDDNVNSLFLSLYQYATAIKEACGFTHTHCIDLYSISGVNKYTAGALLADGLHPNQNGAKLLAEIIYRSISGYSAQPSTDRRLIHRQVTTADIPPVSAQTPNSKLIAEFDLSGAPLTIHNMKHATIYLDGECVPTGSGAMLLAVNDISTGYNTVGVSNVEGFFLYGDTYIAAQIDIDMVKGLGYYLSQYQAAAINPQVNPAVRTLRGFNSTSIPNIAKISIFSTVKTIKAGTVLELYKKY